MDIRLVNNCKMKYARDPVKIIYGILAKMPEKYLVGLKEISLFDESNDPVVKYIKGKTGENNSEIKIYMGGISKGKRFSVLHFNLLLLGLINDHIVQHLQPSSHDPEILSFKPHRYNREWMYLGRSSYILIPLKLMQSLYEKCNPFKSWLDRKRDKLINEIPKNT